MDKDKKEAILKGVALGAVVGWTVAGLYFLFTYYEKNPTIENALLSLLL